MSASGNMVISAELDNDEAVMQEEAMIGLVDLKTEPTKTWDAERFPSALLGILRLLLKDEWPNLQEYAAWALANLSAANTSRNKHKIARFPLVLASLVRLLSTKHSGTREEVVRALRNLACARENNNLIAQFPVAFSALTKIMLDNSVPAAQYQATMAILNLLGNALASRERIKNGLDMIERNSERCPDALECLVRLWFPKGSPNLQARATAAVVKLVEETLVTFDFGVDGWVNTGGWNMEKIEDFPNALVRLLRSLLVESMSVKQSPVQ